MIDDQQEFNIIKNMLKLIYYVPESHLELTKKAIFEAGAESYL